MANIHVPDAAVGGAVKLALTAMEDRQNPQFLENPFVKAQNRDWSIAAPASLRAPVSPPRKRRRQSSSTETPANKEKIHISDPKPVSPSLAEIEAGRAQVDDHIKVFSSRLLAATRPPLPSVPRISHTNWINLYLRNQHPHGRHFVIHQHDHPVAGPHYDLRLQFSETSSLSFAIMYGLPGNANSRRLNRNATETRVHNLWVSEWLVGRASVQPKQKLAHINMFARFRII